MKGDSLRKKFLDYFRQQGHEIVPSLSLVPFSDPTLLFTNAGMVQFKDIFLGRETRNYQKAVSVQKCMRAGGKHNDLELVGRTIKHHTFFEMLGNFSFGDYFKQGAICLAWEFLTEVLKLPPEELWITVYLDDDQAFDLWHKKIGIKKERIIRQGGKDNFWSMGKIGPCGPCSEIHLDRGPAKGCGRDSCDPGCDCGRFVELWNLVFMQYNRDQEGKLTPLPSPCIDTGMGLERLSTVIQGVESNYDTDLFAPLIKKLEKMAGKSYTAPSFSGLPAAGPREQISFRVIADHLRAATFLLSDGVIPSNEGRGYVLRRIIRRASREGRILGKNNPFLYRLSGRVIEMMKDAYPELKKEEEQIARFILAEEEGFALTLESGMARLEEAIARLKKEGKQSLKGEEAFILYDTYGFPLDITREILEENRLSLDREGFHRALQRQREKTRRSWKGEGAEGVESIYRQVLKEKGDNLFIGYDRLEAKAILLAIIKKDAEEEKKFFISRAEGGDSVELVFSATPFYAESGGQVGDQGIIINGSGSSIEIKDVLKPLPGLFLHQGVVKKGRIICGEEFILQVDKERRQKIAVNHTLTHLLHSALRQVLGSRVRQAGSLVSEGRLRFDYTHFAPPQKQELERIEALVNEKIRENIAVKKQEMTLREALEQGATALFGEKYGERVRLISIGDYSKELCGGTHLKATGEGGIFSIISEGAVAAGIRRIEALTGVRAYNFLKENSRRLEEISLLLKAVPGEEITKLRKIFTELKEKNKELEREKKRALERRFQKEELKNNIRKIKGVNVLSLRLNDLDLAALRSFLDQIKNYFPANNVTVLGSSRGERVYFVSAVSKDLTSRIRAGELIREISALAGGNGGGRPEMAQGGGKNPQRLDAALSRVYEWIEEKIS